MNHGLCFGMGQRMEVSLFSIASEMGNCFYFNLSGSGVFVLNELVLGT